MTDTPNRPPLWVVLRQARFDVYKKNAAAYIRGEVESRKPTEEEYAAAEIRALRDWLKGELPEVGAWYVLLTAEAERAERGE